MDKVYVVVYMDYDPPDDGIDSIWKTRSGAERRLAEIGEPYQISVRYVQTGIGDIPAASCNTRWRGDTRVALKENRNAKSD
jgi:hypothetical protein